MKSPNTAKDYRTGLVLEYRKENPNSSLAEISKALDIPPSSVYFYLNPSKKYEARRKRKANKSKLVSVPKDTKRVEILGVCEQCAYLRKQLDAQIELAKGFKEDLGAQKAQYELRVKNLKSTLKEFI